MAAIIFWCNEPAVKVVLSIVIKLSVYTQNWDILQRYTDYKNMIVHWYAVLITHFPYFPLLCNA